MPTGPLVHGQVRESDGTALEGAVLTLLDTAGHEAGLARTDGFGAYLLAAPAPGEYVVVATAPGFLPVARPVRVGGTGGALNLYVAALDPRLAGTVLDASGEPVEGAAVVLTDLEGVLRARTSTRAEGRYALGGLDAGAYTLTVITPGRLPAAEAVTVPEDGCATEDLVLGGEGTPDTEPGRSVPSYS
jgi:hypothetical protein